MYKTKLKFFSFIVLAVICILLVVFATLIYIEAEHDIVIFSLEIAKHAFWKVISVIMFAVSAIFFVASFIVFIFYVLAVSHNNAIIEKVKKIKESFAKAKSLSIETVDEELIKLKKEIDDAKKNGIELKNPYLTGEVNQQTITIKQTGPNGTVTTTKTLN